MVTQETVGWHHLPEHKLIIMYTKNWSKKIGAKKMMDIGLTRQHQILAIAQASGFLALECVVNNISKRGMCFQIMRPSLAKSEHEGFQYLQQEFPDMKVEEGMIAGTKFISLTDTDMVKFKLMYPYET